VAGAEVTEPARLARATLARVPEPARRRTAPPDLRPGILHLGLGAFHRAHQAVHTEDAVGAAGGDWGIVAVAPRSPRVSQPLSEQDRLFSVTSVAGDVETTRVVGVLAEALHAPSDPMAVVARIADPATRVVTLTVTEKGYRMDPASGRLRTGDPELAADLDFSRPPRTVPGLLVRGLAARAAAGGPPLTVLSCDNLPSNGRTLAGLVAQALERAPSPVGERTADWVAANAAFPCSMVDRIVPAPDDATRDRARARLGVADQAAVETEPFTQWVIQDTFPGGRPAWEAAGAVLTTDVTPWETLKLRVLNGAHSTLAYLGALAGRATVAEALELPGMQEFLLKLLLEDVAPTLTLPPGVDLETYCKTVLERFANRTIEYRTLQVAMDGSQKLPQRLVRTVEERLAAGGTARWAALAVAAWIRFVQGRDDQGGELPLDDPFADRLRDALTGTQGRPEAAAEAILGLPEVFGTRLRDHAAFRSAVAGWLATLQAHGVADTLAGLRSSG
jgi:fructuronate reductase